MPSGGDWALHRGGAIFVEGAEDVAFKQCHFEQLDGNAVFWSGYTRWAVGRSAPRSTQLLTVLSATFCTWILTSRRCEVSNSSFVYIGDNAVAAWGYTRPLKGQPELDGLAKGPGIDGTGGEQPRQNRMTGCIVREIGFNERQSSAFGQFKSCQVHGAG